MGPRPASTARLWGPVWPLGEDPAELPSPDLRRLERTWAKEVGNRESPGCLREGQEERHPSWKPVSTDGSHGLGCAARRLCPRRRPSPPGFRFAPHGPAPPPTQALWEYTRPRLSVLNPLGEMPSAPSCPTCSVSWAESMDVINPQSPTGLLRGQSSGGHRRLLAPTPQGDFCAEKKSDRPQADLKLGSRAEWGPMSLQTPIGLPPWPCCP